MDKDNFDSVFVIEGSEARKQMLAKEEELLDAWLDEIYRPDATEAAEAMFDMAANGIPIVKNGRLKVGARDLNGRGEDMCEARPKPAVEVGLSFSF